MLTFCVNIGLETHPNFRFKPQIILNSIRVSCPCVCDDVIVFPDLNSYLEYIIVIANTNGQTCVNKNQVGIHFSVLL